MSNYKKTLAISTGFYCLLLGAPASQADFALNWAARGDIFGVNNPAANCNRAEGSVQCRIQSAQVSILDPDNTPFLQERITGSDGQTYYHVIVGLPTDKFSQETFIRAGGTVWAPSFVSAVGSSSGGSFTFQGSGPRSTVFNNQRPLDADENISGNSTGNPKRVEMRQVNNDGEFFQEFVKESVLVSTVGGVNVFNNKPRITQTLNNADISATFVADMRNLNYDDINTGVPITNTIVFADGAGNFDMALDGQLVNVTAGKYRWVPGTGPDQSSGTYQYLEGGYDPYLENWQSYRSPTENITKR